MVENHNSNFSYENNFDYKDSLFCSKCFLTGREFEESGFLGCENCYKVFKTLIDEYISQTQLNNFHTGKIYASQEKSKIINQIKQLEKEVKDFVIFDREQIAKKKEQLAKLKEKFYDK